MKKVIAVLMIAATIFMLVGCSGSEGNTEGSNNVIIVVENYGEIHVTLTPEHAPITVKNFKKLINEGAYDGTIFHRVINNFMIQGGDTTLTSYGRADTIKGEFAKNGVNNRPGNDSAEEGDVVSPLFNSCIVIFNARQKFF